MYDSQWDINLKKNENGDQGWEKGCDKAQSSVSNVCQRI